MTTLRDRVAVVTGAASGIGLAMAQAFAAEGMKLVLADIEQARLDAALQGLRAQGATAIGRRVDVAIEAEVQALADAAWAEYGAVHVVCNNAGVAAPSLMTNAWQAPIADWQWILNVNLMGVLYGVRAFVPRMLEQGEEGHIVNTASVAGLLTGANPYHVSKQGVTCITEGLYRDLRRAGAKVSASVLCPGLIRTDIMKAERNRPA
ncbi:MAG: SDR family NAD(P)-dependent oxidoreductase, partial [Burkholderiales bacterium]